MSDLDLDSIEARANAAMLSPTGQQYDAGVVLSTDVPALVAEVRSLRTHLAHAAEVEAALTSDLLAAHVEVEQLRVTRATDRNRLRHTRKALAKTRLLLEIRAEQTERLLTHIARVRALCAEADDGEYTSVFAAAILAALDVRHDPMALAESVFMAEARASGQYEAERDDWRRRYEALRDGVTGLHFRDARGWCASCFDPDGFSVWWPCETAAVVARVEGDES